MPPNDAPLYVQMGNELNLAWSCKQALDGQHGNSTPECLSMDQVALEVGCFLRDVLAEISTVPRNVLVAASPIAPIGPRAMQCVAASSACPGHKDISLTSLDFLAKMLAAVPDVYEHAQWLASHAYPCSQPGCGLHDGTHAPAAPCGGWNTPFARSIEWLTAYRNETALISTVTGRAPLQVLITETGWCMDCCTESQRALWTLQAYEQLWLPDTAVLGVTPFLLAGAQWWPKGFPWMFANGTKLPVYTALQALRKKTLGHDV
eukprot:m.894868 g.894868  ORF g.894868 m.894868 type:complete len:262 (-) comp23664_c1_seq48:3019-3804(-)